jgi:hypothetical protein
MVASLKGDPVQRKSAHQEKLFSKLSRFYFWKATLKMVPFFHENLSGSWSVWLKALANIPQVALHSRSKVTDLSSVSRFCPPVQGS